MTYKLRHKKSKLFYRHQRRSGGVRTNLDTEGNTYGFKPTASGRGCSYFDRKGVRRPMKDSEWEAVEWKGKTLAELADEGFGSESPSLQLCPHCGKQL